MDIYVLFFSKFQNNREYTLQENNPPPPQKKSLESETKYHQPTKRSGEFLAGRKQNVSTDGKNRTVEKQNKGNDEDFKGIYW